VFVVCCLLLLFVLLEGGKKRLDMSCVGPFSLSLSELNQKWKQWLQRHHTGREKQNLKGGTQKQRGRKKKKTKKKLCLCVAFLFFVLILCVRMFFFPSILSFFVRGPTGKETREGLFTDEKEKK
jgi:hypothetical protein